MAVTSMRVIGAAPGAKPAVHAAAATQSRAGIALRVPHAQSRRARAVVCRAEGGESEVKVEEVDTKEESETTLATGAETNGNGAGKEPEATELPSGEVKLRERSGMDKFMTSSQLFFGAPWRRIKKDSVLAIKFGGEISEQKQGRFGSGMSMPSLCEALEKAAYDPRIVGVCLKIEPLAVGWAQMQEIGRYMALFKESGKWSVAYCERGGEKEYWMGSQCDEFYIPPAGGLLLKGFSVSGTFLRGVLDKIGIGPEVRRIGKYKSAGDQLLRTDMSEEQREQLTAILEGIYGTYCSDIAAAKGKTVEEVRALLDSDNAFSPEALLEGGWITGMKYEDEIIADMKARTGGKEDELRSVPLKKYQWVDRAAFGMEGKQRIAVLRFNGAITGTAAQAPAGQITSGAVISRLRGIKKNKAIKAVVLRVDSPGGDALASDLMWREIGELSKEKPVVASMGNVAASGGYYMAMGCDKIVAEPLTVTGSIGVVSSKFNLAGLYEKAGYTKEVISRGKFAEILSEHRPQDEEEAAYFDKYADYAYRSFRDKAAGSRGMEPEELQEFAQGRVWLGADALERGLVDAVGGVSRAVAIAKKMAKIDDDEKVSVLEVSKAQMSPLALLSGGGASLSAVTQLLTALTQLQSATSASGAVDAAIATLLQVASGGATGAGAGATGAMGLQYAADENDVTVRAVGSDMLTPSAQGLWAAGDELWE